MRYEATRTTADSEHDNWAIEQLLMHYGWDGQERGPRRMWTRVRCPFHYDRNASAGVSYELNSFNCMGCDASGNSVTLVMQQEGLEAREAVEWLDSTIDRPEGSKPEASERRSRPKQRIPWEPMTLH